MSSAPIVLTPLVGVVRVIRAELASEDFPGAVSDVVRASSAAAAEPVDLAAQKWVDKLMS